MKKKTLYIKPQLIVYPLKLEIMQVGRVSLCQDEDYKKNSEEDPTISKEYDIGGGGYRQVGKIGFIEDDEW